MFKILSLSVCCVMGLVAVNQLNATGDVAKAAHKTVSLSALFTYMPPVYAAIESKDANIKVKFESRAEYLDKNATQVIPNERLTINDKVELPLGKSTIEIVSSY